MIAAGIGTVGMFTWRRQLTGTSKLEKAKKLLISVYRIRGSIHALRNSNFNNNEAPVFHLTVSDEDISSAEFRKYLVVAYKQRWSRFESAFEEFNTVRAEPEVLLGIEIKNICY